MTFEQLFALHLFPPKNDLWQGESKKESGGYVHAPVCMPSLILPSPPQVPVFGQNTFGAIQLLKEFLLR